MLKLVLKFFDKVIKMSLFLIAVIAVIAMFILCCYLAYRKAFYNKKGKKKDSSVLPSSEQYSKVSSITDALYAEMKEQTFEDVYIKAHDGKRLYGRYYHICDGAPIHIQFHGYRSSSLHDFCGGHKLARELGHNVLAIDQRAHGNSQGHTISFGIKERFDCISWAEYLIGRFGDDTRIILSGISMGAATVLMAAGERLPENIVGVIADCPYSSPKEIILSVCADMGIHPKLGFPFVYIGALLFGGFNLTECDAVRGAMNSSVPVLLIHGEADDFVPISMSYKISKANPEAVKFVPFPEAGHGLSYVVDTERYTNEVAHFINKIVS